MRLRSLFLLLAPAALLALTLAAGFWQLDRAAQKARIRDRLEQASHDAPVLLDDATPASAAALQFQRVEAHGEFDARHTIYLDNRLRNGVPGYEVLTPLRLRHAYVLVSRGWVAAGARRAELPAVALPAGVVRVSGIALGPAPRFVELSTGTAAGALWQNVTVERFARATGLTLLPLILRQDDAAGDGLDRHWPAPDLGIDRHRAYAFQWFSLATLTLVATLVFHVRRRRSPPHQPA